MSQLQPTIRFLPLMLIVVGGCIGGGIFITPSQVAAEAPYASLIILLWIIGGIIALTGALTFSELGAMFPKAGGVYVFLKEAYGPYPAFLFGWTNLMAVTSGALAALSLAFASFIALMVPMSDTAQLFLAAGTLAAATVINVLGVRLGEAFTALFTSLKVLGILVIVVCGLFLSASPHTIDFSLPSFDGNMAMHFMLGLTGVYWAYGGWHHATYVSAEVINPQKNLSRAMIAGTLIVMTVYLLGNMAYLNAMPVEGIAASKRVAADMMESILPGWGGKIIVGIVCVSVFGSIAVFTMTAPRIYFAMAADKVFFKQLTYVHPKFKTPMFAIILQSVWAIVLLFAWKTFSDLISYVSFTETVFLVLAGIALFLLRRKVKEKPVFRVPLSPFTPVLYILLSAVFVINGMIMKPEQGLAALVLFAAGTIVFLLFRRSVG